MLAGFRATRCFSTVSRWTPSAQTVSNVNASLWQVPTAATQQSIKLQCDFGMPLVHQTDFDLWQHQDSIVDAFECPNDSGLTDTLQAVKRTYQPSVLRRKRKHGFLNRKSTVAGRRILRNRRIKNRWRLSA